LVCDSIYLVSYGRCLYHAPTVRFEDKIFIALLINYFDWNVLIFPRNALSSVQRNKRTHVWLIDWLIFLIICFITDIATVLLSCITQHGLYCLLIVDCYVDSFQLVNLTTVYCIVPNRQWVIRSGKKAQHCGMQSVYYLETCAKVIYNLPSTIFVPWVLRVWWTLWLSND
jgi:hypothetical protein